MPSLFFFFTVGQAIMRYIFCWLCFFLSTLSVVAQLHVDPIQDIREKYALITQARDDKQLTTHTFEYECPYETGGGRITFFYQGEALRLIEYSFYEGEHYGGTDQFYVWDGVPFFVFLDHASWRFDYQNGDFQNPQTVEELSEKRMYLENGAPIRCLHKAYKRYSRLTQNLHTNQVPNQEIDCAEAIGILSTFTLLLEWEDGSKSSDSCSLFE